ncbi:MAG: hypothetical protein HWD61_10665 [Parachlamydiaceae bacterium]|nr:MAG: hypothetical protein HWD61_10665 [Parachlamydiaceae bacterium]
MKHLDDFGSYKNQMNADQYVLHVLNGHPAANGGHHDDKKKFFCQRGLNSSDGDRILMMIEKKCF